MRSTAELRDVVDPAWPEIVAMIDDAAQPVEVLSVDTARGEETLTLLQVTARSWLGALALNCGGLLIDHGWLRMLGGGDAPFNLAVMNQLRPGNRERPPMMIVALDVLGGRYAINGGALPGAEGEVSYFAPDELSWQPTGLGHGDFVAWCMSERFESFNRHLRWPGWEVEVAAAAPDQGIALYPFPFSREGRDPGTVTRTVVPILELLDLYDDLAHQLEEGTDREA